MKKLFLFIALIAFVGTANISGYANNNFAFAPKCEKCGKGKDHKCDEKCEKDCKKAHCKKDGKSCDKKASCTSKDKEGGKKCTTAKTACSHSSKDSIPAH